MTASSIEDSFDLDLCEFFFICENTDEEVEDYCSLGNCKECEKYYSFKKGEEI